METVCQIVKPKLVLCSLLIGSHSHMVQKQNIAVLDLVSKFEFLSYNKPTIMTFLSDKQIIRLLEYMEECHLQDL